VFLQQHAVGDDKVLRHATTNRALTAGDIHTHIHHLSMLQGLEDSGDFIFTAGRNAVAPPSATSTTSLPGSVYLSGLLSA